MIALGVVVVTAVVLVGDLAHGIAAWLVGLGFRWIPLRAVPGDVGSLLLRGGSARAPLEGALRPVPREPWWLTVVIFSALLCAGGGAVAWFRRPSPRTRTHKPTDPGPAAWASRRSIAAILVRRRTPGRLVLGRFGGLLIASEASHSLLVIGPTQSGKTSGLVIPALLEWDGPVIATSVKRDLLDATIARRRQVGKVDVYDPTATSGLGSASWNPLDPAREWAGAKRIAANLCNVARAASGDLDDGAFWYSTAEKMLAPLLFAAANTGLAMGDVIRWVDLRQTEEPMGALVALGVPVAWQAAVASFDREDRQLSSVYATVENVLSSFADPHVELTSRSGGIDPVDFLDAPASTIYLVAPTRAQERLAPVFVALLGELLEAAFDRGSRQDREHRRLLVVLDEAANIAPVRDLDVLASTAASYGIQLVTVFQDLTQIETRYGPRAATVVNNHRARLVGSGIADAKTLNEVSVLVGDGEYRATSRTEGDGQRSMTWSDERRLLATADALRRIPPGEGVLVYGHLPPVRLRLRPWFADRSLRRLAAGARITWVRQGGFRLGQLRASLGLLCTRGGTLRVTLRAWSPRRS